MSEPLARRELQGMIVRALRSATGPRDRAWIQRETGRRSGCVYYAIRSLERAGMIRRDGVGKVRSKRGGWGTLWALTELGRWWPVGRLPPTVRDALVIGRAREVGQVDRDDVCRLLGCSRVAADSRLSDLRRAGLLAVKSRILTYGPVGLEARDAA